MGEGAEDLEWLNLINIIENTKVGWGPLLVVMYAISQLTSTYLMSATMQPAQRALMLVLPIAFIPFVLNFPAGLMLYWLTTNLWTTGQGLITRRLTPKREPPPKKSSRTPPKSEVRRRCRCGGGEAGRGEARSGRPAAREEGQAQEGRRPPVTELSVEATGETVGEAKWSALRDLERKRPGLDKAAVRFQVVSEGERGLLGVGYEPARVVASIEDDRRCRAVASPAPAARTRQPTAPAFASSSSESRTSSGSTPGSPSPRADEELRATCDGAELGMLIGKHGQTIDAIQYLGSAILYRGRYDERKRIVVDAAGYRARRQVTLDALALRLAEQASATGQRVELEPMTAVERKIVHERLKDDPEIETLSEGTEPNRYVVIRHVSRRETESPC